MYISDSLSSEELKELAFFKNINWDDVLHRKVSAEQKSCVLHVNAG